MNKRRDSCEYCGGPVVQPAGAGRPRRFCSKSCQRSSRYRRRKLERGGQLDQAALLDRSNPQVRDFLKELGV